MNIQQKQPHQSKKTNSYIVHHRLFFRPTLDETTLTKYLTRLGLSKETIEDCKGSRMTLTCRRITEAIFPLASDRQSSRSSKLNKKQIEAIRGEYLLIHFQLKRS